MLPVCLALRGSHRSIRTSHELAGGHCAFGGVRFESGLDADGDGTLEDGEVNDAETQFTCQSSPGFPELPKLPPKVTSVHSFALHRERG